MRDVLHKVKPLAMTKSLRALMVLNEKQIISERTKKSGLAKVEMKLKLVQILKMRAKNAEIGEQKNQV